MKMKMIHALGLMATLFCGSASAVQGDVWEILPCHYDEATTMWVDDTPPVSSVFEPLPAGEKVTFKVRLVASATEGATHWHIRNTQGSSTEDYLNPPRIGIYVSGKLTYADYIGEMPVGEHFTDVYFQYMVKPGDFALPIRLATKDGPADQAYHEDLSYLFDPLTSWRWRFSNNLNEDCNWWFFQGDPMERGEANPADTQDFSLRDAGFYLKTIDFDGQWEEEPKYDLDHNLVSGLWRSVHEGSTSTVGPNPALAANAGSEAKVTLYVWSTNEEFVCVKSDKVVRMRVGGTGAEPITKDFHVAAVTFERGQLTSNFEIEGIKCTNTTDLVLSAYDHFKYSDSTEERDLDYVTVPVKCVGVLPPSIQIRPEKKTVTATSDYLTYVTELTVKFTVPYTNDVTFTITPRFESDEAREAGADWKDYIRVSGEKELSSLSTATNFTFTIPAGSLIPMENGSERKIYLYALRSDKYTINAAHLQFVAKTADEAAAADIGGFGETQGDINIEAQDPEIIAPAEGDVELKAIAGKPRTLYIAVTDTYADMLPGNDGYQIFIVKDSDGESTFEPIGGADARYTIGQGGYLYSPTNTLPTVVYTTPVNGSGVAKSIIYVKSPVSGHQSAERRFSVTVTEPAGFTVSTVDGRYSFMEGDEVQIQVTLDQKNSIGKALYAFLVPVTTRDAEAVDCLFLAQTNGVSNIAIEPFGESASGSFTMIDGCSSTALNQFSYKVELRDNRVYQDGQLVEVYQCKGSLLINSQNVIPAIKYVQMNGNRNQRVSVSGGEMPLKLPASDTLFTTFTVSVDEPGTADKTSTNQPFQVRWTLEDEQGTPQDPPSGCDGEGIIYGNPDEMVCSNNFTSAGRYKFTIDLKDKDMSEFGNGVLDGFFEFYVNVLDQPAITITPNYISSYDRFYETEAGEANFDIELEQNVCAEALSCVLTVQSPGYGEPGIFRLQTREYSPQTGGVISRGGGVYQVIFPPKKTKVNLVAIDLDGTQATASKAGGFSISARIEGAIKNPAAAPGTIDEDYVVPNSGNKKPQDYYMEGGSQILLENVAPQVGYVSPLPGTNLINVAIGPSDRRIYWSFDDVDNDFTRGINVQIIGGGGFKTNFTDRAEANKFGEDVGFQPYFEDSNPDATVELIITDPDKGVATWQGQQLIWHFAVQVSKTLAMIPHGPASGKGTPLSRQYGAADGIGEGHVWASGDKGAKGWEHTVNCGLANDWTVYGYGYRVNDKDSGSLLPHDIKVDGSGDSGTLLEAYGYPDKERDSFLYTWLQVVRGESGKSVTTATRLNETITPEHRENNMQDTGSIVGLPAESNDKDGGVKTYDKTIVEAIFSKEMYPADNCGDINQDGIPDVYVEKYKFGLIDENGQVTGDDLVKLATYNKDGVDGAEGEGDFLPMALNVTTTVLSGDPKDLVAFKALEEIRGFGTGLNDATKLWGARVEGVTPTKNYTDPETDPTSSLSKLEYEAFLKAQENGATVETWSPERPTNPTLRDTDEDGFDDGFEYFFWYRAHVGYYDEDGNYQRLTGRKFDETNPLAYKTLTPDEIAELSDPITPAGSTEEAVTRDSDNDGLPDLLEYYLGTNPFDCDTDNDGMIDGWEVLRGLDPLKTTEIKAGRENNNPDHDFMADALIEEGAIVTFTVTDGEKTETSFYLTSEKDYKKLYDDDQTTPFYGAPLLKGEGVVLEDAFFSFNGVPSSHVLSGAKIPKTRALKRRLVRIPADATDVEITKVTWADRYHLLHDQVYAYFGFDPRTAWNRDPDSVYVSRRWNPAYNSGAKKLDEAGKAVNTRDYETLDEFLLYQYRFATGIGLSGENLMDKLEKNTTNPSLPFETKTYVDTDVGAIESESESHGADTDGDGIPDGWELYVGASHLFDKDELKKGNFVEDVAVRISPNDDKDGIILHDDDALALALEYAGTDSTIAYYDVDSIKANAGKVWPNKFFPTDPWNADTDGDGLKDLGNGTEPDEGSDWKAGYPFSINMVLCNFSFRYSKYDLGTDPETYDFTTLCFRGGGMNPCSVDTDRDGLPDPWERQFAGVPFDENGNAMLGNPTELYTTDMKLADGFLTDDNAETDVTTNEVTVVAKGSFIVGGMDATYAGDAWSGNSQDPRTGTKRDMDFDGDGLQNYQEYLVQSIRQFRYDDTETPLNGRVIQWTGDERDDNDFTFANVTVTDIAKGYTYPPFDYLQEGKSYDAVVAETDLLLSEHNMLKAYIADANLYPNGVTSDAGVAIVEPQKWNFAKMGYFANCPHEWDPWNLHDDGQKYCVWGGDKGYKLMLPPTSLRFFWDGASETPIGVVLGENMGRDGQYRLAASGYVSTDPRMRDTDNDGMDDYYELYHGLNPIYGGALAGSAGTDVIGQKYNLKISVLANGWNLFDLYRGMSSQGVKYDFVKYPWLAGAPDADPDGDKVRNADEMISGNRTSPTTMHSDPSPLWMTEPTAKLAVTRQGYLWPAMDLLKGGTQDWLRYPWEIGAAINKIQGVYPAMTEGAKYQLYAYSFERNEGFDTDGDWASDAREQTKNVGPQSDPLYFGDPLHREALYLDGAGAAYQVEFGGQISAKDAYDMFRQFTVECWVKPESCSGEEVLVERGSLYQPATDGEIQGEAHWRANFRLYLEDGIVKGMFDSSAAVESGTDEPQSCCKVVGEALKTNEWSHVALTYDGHALSLYVNGGVPHTAGAALIPANGILLISQEPKDGYYPASSYSANTAALVVGARHTDKADPAFFPLDGTEFDGGLKSGFHGYVAEVRVWDGVRSEMQIQADMGRAYTLDDVATNRLEVYKAWKEGRTRNDAEMAAAGLDVLPAQLMMHYNFNSLPNATNTEHVLQVPVGFGVDPAVDNDLQSPGWWTRLAATVRSAVYKDNRVIPWIQNTVLHLPKFDDGFADSMYWNETHAAYLSSAVSGRGFESYVIPNTANPYGVESFGLERYHREFQLRRLSKYDSSFADANRRHEFELRSSFVGSSDLVAIGTAWAKRDLNYWDGKGAMTSWTDTGTDSDYDGLPDWWVKLYEQYAKDQGIDKIAPTTVDPKTGLTFAELYARDLAKGLSPDATSKDDYAVELIDETDRDDDGMPDWWENFYGVQGDSVNDSRLDSDNDGLSNLNEYRIWKKLIPGVAYELFPNERTTDGKTLDYFRTYVEKPVSGLLQAGPVAAGRRYYLGETVGDHDFMEDFWEDRYDSDFISRNYYDAGEDPDNDGWSNYAEIRAGTDPTKTRHSGIEDQELADYPIPMIHAQVQLPKDAPANAAIIFQAYSGKLTASPDAIWKTSSSNSAERISKEKIIGVNPSVKRRYFLSPGSISPGEVEIHFNDQNAVTYTYAAGAAQPQSAVVTGSGWQNVLNDRQRRGDEKLGDIIDSGDNVLGWVNYETGEMEIDFSLARSQGIDMSGATGNGAKEGTRVILVLDLTSAYVKFVWQARVVKQGATSNFYLTEADTGYVREGQNTIIAFADVDGDGMCGANEPFGIARGVNIGWSQVPDLMFALSSESAIGPRIALGSFTDKQNVRVVRTGLTDTAGNTYSSRSRVVWTGAFKDVENVSLTEANWLKSDTLDLDWKYLTTDVAAEGLSIDALRSVAYEVSAGTNKITFVKEFPTSRTKPSLVKPTADAYGYVHTANPAFTFAGMEGYTAFILEIMKEGDAQPVFAATNLLPAAMADGYRYAAPVYVGDGVLEEGKTYLWRICGLNAKYTTAGGWSDWGRFTMATDSKNGDTDCGKLTAEVRYYGPATNALDEVVVEVHRSADFTDAPLARKHLAAQGGVTIQSLTNDLGAAFMTVKANVAFDGIPAGDCYVMAYVDRNRNGTRETYESWGYLNNIGTTAKDLYSPVAVTVSGDPAVQVPACLVAMEDTDINQNKIPDCLEDESTLVRKQGGTGTGSDIDHDGLDEEGEDEYGTEPTLWDTDGDGMPDGWEAKFAGTDPLFADADVAIDGDVMAYAEVDRVLLTLSDGSQYILPEGVARPKTEGITKAIEINGGRFLSIYQYGAKIGLGAEVNVADESLYLDKVEDVKVALVHNQVYQEFGFDTHTANPVDLAANSSVNTKPFTALDKYFVWAYLRAIGYTNVQEECEENWKNFTLRPYILDNNNDGIYDGWQLYVMFGPEGQVAKATPWTSRDAAGASTPGGEGLNWVEEFDRGNYPTDPWQASTFKDTYTTDEGTFTISDKDAYAYHLKGTHKYEDADNDGLINYTEYVSEKNGDYTLNVDKMCSYFGLVTIPQLTDQCVPDYFLKSLRSPKYYEGFKNTSHDFLESWWKDSYNWTSLMTLNKEPRKFFMPYDDPDADGWDNWSEARAGTNPRRDAVTGVNALTLEDYPVPFIPLTINGEPPVVDCPIYIKAWPTELREKYEYPSAVWRTSMKAFKVNGPQEEPETEGELRYLGVITGGVHRVNLSPGSILPSSVTLMKCTGGVNGSWGGIVTDYALLDDQTKGGFFCDKTNQVGSIDYITGEVTIAFDMLSGIQRDFSATNNDDTTVSTEGNYYKLTYHSVISERDFPVTLYLSKPLETEETEETEGGLHGHIRQGRNDFIVYADENNNKAYDPGEPFGMAYDVDVGWDSVSNLNITLSKTTSVLPRFNPLKLTEVAEAAEDAGSLSNAIGQVIAGKPVVVDVAKDTYVHIARWTINDQECKHRVVFSKKLGSFEVVTEADVLSKTVFDLDWKHLEKDAHDNYIDLKGIDKIVYAVFVGDVARTEENVNGWIVKKFPHNRANATPVAPTAADTAIINATRPEFEFKVPEGYPAYAFELINATGKVVFCSTNLVTAKNAAGHVVYQPPVYFGAEAEDLVNHLLPTGRYSWSVAMLNAKFRETKGGWCTAAEFDVRMAKGKVHDTDKGILEVAVRYYGEADITPEHPVIVQAFRSADFTGVPAAQAVITNETGVLGVYDDTNTVNVAMYGLVPGDYYVRAFIDTTNDVVRSTWESWGYQNNVGTGRADLYTPISTKVERNITSSALVFIEDMDTNNDGKPDCLQPFKPDDGHPHDDDEDIDSDGDGMPDEEEEEIGTDPYDWDTDGDGMPDGWEEWAGTDPLTPDADYAVPDDVMAYEEVEMWLITLEDGTQLLLKDGETVPKPGDSLANYGEAFYVPYWYGAPSGDGIYGRGQPTAAPTGAMVNGDGDNNPRKVTVALVHDQVYDEFGFDPNTAVPGGTVHTKDFTALDKYLLLRYREMMGSTYWADGFDPSVLDSGDYDDIEDYVNQKKLWSDWTLKPGYPDNDAQPTNPDNGEAGIGDGIGDGWELFTHHNPWNYFDRNTDNDGDGATLLDEYDYDPETGKANPTDPRNIDTDGDGVTDDLYHRYLLHDPAGDKDGDGLSNYAEYLITEVFKYDNLDPRNPMTDGHCVDYFRKLGELYFGEIFTDHDQVGDVWEGVYNDVANRYVYDPNRDDDEDGWSNYAEFRADTNPRETSKLGVTVDGKTHVHAEYPVPVIEAKVVYNGHQVNLDNVVFKAWNEKTDPDMTSAPDAIWTLPTLPGDGESTLVDYEKYLDIKPVGEQQYLLHGGSVGEGTVELKVFNPEFDVIGIPSTNNTDTVTSNATATALWYLAANDKGGRIVTLEGAEIGSVDYSTGLVRIDFSKLSGKTIGDPSPAGASPHVFATRYTATNGGHDYVEFSFDTARVLLTWKAVKVGTNPAGRYYLAAADAVTAEARHHGWVREGLNTFVCYVSADGFYTPGTPFGVVRGVDVGWQGAKFTVELTETSAITPRISLWTDTDDRSVTIADINRIMINDRTIQYWTMGVAESNKAAYIAAKLQAVSNRVQTAVLEQGKKTHVRVVRYGIDDMFCYLAGVYESGEGRGFEQQVVLDKTFNQDARDFINEGDFLGADQFDIDWDTLSGTDFTKGAIVDEIGDTLGTDSTGPKGAGLKVTNMTYLVVIGDGAKDFRGTDDTNTIVHALYTTVNRRFELVRHLPVAKGQPTLVYSARPTFTWAIPDEEPWAKEFGSSYTSFKIQILDTADTVVYDSGVVRAPAQDKDGNFVWTAPVCAGDQTSLGKIFGRAGNWKWRVAMFNAKFKPQEDSDMEVWGEGINRGEFWSNAITFSTDVGMQQVIDDHNYSAIGVTVKYAGPAKVLDHCTDTTTTNGMVRIQAFTTADFAGEPVSQAFIADRTSLTDTTDVTVNGMLYGLPVEGTYYIRAYIDSNGNFRKDDWESWGYAKTGVTLTPDLRAQQNVGIYIEDADTDQDWLPDAWEYETYGDLMHENTYVDPEGKIRLRTQTYQVVKSGKANISTTLPGASLTLFQNLDAARMLLGAGNYTEDTLSAIRAAIEKNVVAKTLKITSLVVDTDKKKVVMTVNGEVAESIAGQILSPVYILPDSSTVTLRLYKKDSLVKKEWTKVKDYDVTVSTTLKTTVEVPMPDVDFSAGFYKIEVVQ